MTTTHSESSLILQSIDDNGICRLTLNRPDKFNALSEQMLAQFQSTVDAIAEDPGIRVVILQANGRAFCAGHDLKEMQLNVDQDYYHQLFKKCSALMISLNHLPQPVIAKVQGIATAAGCLLVANCDLAVASQQARFAVSGINLGLFCHTPGVALSRNISRKRALAMLFSGDFIDAETAADYGLINYSVDPEKLDEEVDLLAQKLSKKSPAALAAGKKNFYQHINQSYEDALATTSEAMACNLMFDETQQQINAFLDK